MKLSILGKTVEDIYKVWLAETLLAQKPNHLQGGHS